MNTLQEIADVIKTLKSAVIFTHLRPDGDTLGSAMALSRALFMLGIENEIVNEGDIPAKFLIFEGMDKIVKTPTLDAQAYICVDTSDEARLGYAQPVFLSGVKKGKVTINIDHHVSNARFCKYNFVRPRSSNCENMAELVQLLGVRPDKLLAGYLMMGMVTDSGAFSHSDVNGDTFRAAAYAADAGADVSEITYQIFKKQTKARSQLYAEVISRLRYDLEDRLAVALVTQEMLKKIRLKAGCHRGYRGLRAHGGHGRSQHLPHGGQTGTVQGIPALQGERQRQRGRGRVRRRRAYPRLRLHAVRRLRRSL